MGPRIAVLGHTTVDGATPTHTQAAIVAALALAGGRPTSTAELIDAVWCERVPASARQSLQNQITRLRRRFGDEVITTDPAGYVLTWGTDAAVFERDAAPWLERDPSAAAVAPLESALALWRGVPYDDLCDHEAVDPERTRLGELRSAAAEQLGRSRIVAGDLRRCAAELSSWCEAEPYREQLWGLLMLALHLDGRRTDALAAYERASTRLARDLGVEPSDPLQALRTQIDRLDAVDTAPWTGAIRPGPDRAGACGAVLRHRGRCHPRLSRSG